MGTSQRCNWCRGQAVVSSMSSGAPHPSRGLGGARPSLAAAFSAILHVLGSPKPPGGSQALLYDTPLHPGLSQTAPCQGRGLIFEEEGSVRTFLSGLEKWDDKVLATSRHYRLANNS